MDPEYVNEVSTKKVEITENIRKILPELKILKRQIENVEKITNLIPEIEKLNICDDASSTTASTITTSKSKRRIRPKRAERIRMKQETEAAEKSSYEKVVVNVNGVKQPIYQTPENLLILTLVRMKRNDRDNYIEQIAKERRILIKTPTGLIVNPELKNFSVEKEQRRREPKPIIVRKQGESREEERALFYEEQVNKLIIENDQNRLIPNLLNANSDKKDSSFETDANQKNLEIFVQTLIDLNVGYLVEGEIRISTKNCRDSFLSNSKGEKDVYFPSVSLRMGSFQGDVVRAFVLNQSDSEKVVGFVVKVLEKNHNRKCIGNIVRIKRDGKFFAFKPKDSKIPMIRIPMKDLPDIKKKSIDVIAEDLYFVEITSYQNENANGKVIQKLGKCGDLRIENKAILIDNNLDPTPYSQEIIDSLPKTPFVIPEEEYKKREDLRKDCIFTIDPSTARDLDDAVSCKALPNGNYQVGVHISDVTYFLQENSELDLLVKEKATSVYMVDAVYHMLPQPLCFLCSLLPGEDKMAFSVFWELTEDGEIISTRFARTVINSCAQLAYEHAQEIIESPEKKFTEEDFPTIHNDFKPEDLTKTVLQLQKLAIVLRKKRFENGALRIDLPKFKIVLDEKTGKPINFYFQEMKDSNRLIEDFMLLANSTVADFIHKKFPEKAILRNHYPPQEKLMKRLNTMLEGFGMAIDTTDSKTIRESLTQIMSKSKNKSATQCIINTLTAKQMTRARYFCSDSSENVSDFWHFALSVPIYTHFTSPIRRYPDMLVHRLLGAALDLNPLPVRTPEELHKITNVCNLQKFNAKNASDESSNLFFLYYVKSIGGIDMRAAVLNVQANQLEVVLIETGNHVKISYKDLKPNVDIKFIEDLQPQAAIFIPKIPEGLSPVTLKMFSECKVKVHVNSNNQLVGTLLFA